MLEVGKKRSRRPRLYCSSYKYGMVNILEWLRTPMGIGQETKNENVKVYELSDRTPEEIRHDIENGRDIGGVTAIQVSAVYACARVIAEGLAQVPCMLQRTSKAGGHEAASDHPLYDLLARSPNSFMTAFEFMEFIGFQLALLGNAYVFVSRDSKGRAIELIPLPAGSVSISNPAFGEVVYRLNVNGQPTYSNRNVWHLKGASLDGGYTGISPQVVAARAIGLASDLEAFGSQLFRNGSNPSGILSTDSVLSKDQALELRALWHAQQSGIGNAHKTAVMTAGTKFVKMQTSANEAQFIEARRYQTEEICRVMRVDPLMIGQATNSASYSSIEQRFLAHLTHTLAPWYQRFEQSAEVNLLTREEQRAGYRVRLDSRSLMKGSAADRASYLTTMIGAGIMTRNEGREFEGLDRVNDPSADTLTPAANLFGNPGTSAAPTAK